MRPRNTMIAAAGVAMMAVSVREPGADVGEVVRIEPHEPPPVIDAAALREADPRRHQRATDKAPCPECGRPFATDDGLQRHRREKHRG